MQLASADSACVPKAKQPASAKGKEAYTPSSSHIDVDMPESDQQQVEQGNDWQVAPDDGWDVDQVGFHSHRPSMEHGRIAGDLAMAQARLTGSRRRRPGTPSGSPHPSKFSRMGDDENEKETHIQQTSSSQPSQDLRELLSLPSSRRVDYETWDLKRYQHAITVEARRRFWSFASETAKQKLTAELLRLSPSTNTQKQARTMGWLPKTSADEGN